MKHTDGKFRIEGLGELYHQGWQPEGEAKAAVLITHGLAEHGGRYMNVVDKLVPQGYAVYAIDHYGHGRSDGTRVFIPKFDDFITPLVKLLGMVKEWHPGKKVFLLGHSMGGLIAAYFLLDHQEKFEGAVLSGPAAKIPDNISSTTLFLSKILSKLAPTAGVLGLDANLISRDKNVVDAYVNDPLVYTGKTTARLGAEMLAGMSRLLAERGRISLPIILMHGSEDGLADPAGSQELYDAVASEDKTLKFYQSYYHEIFNDIGKEAVLNDLYQWLEAHL